MFPYILLAGGLLMIFLEFYLPGGIMGAIGALAVLASIALFAMQSESIIAIMLFTIVAIVLVVFVFRFALWRIRHAKPGTSIYSEDDQEGYVASAFDESAIGKVGIVESDLRPGGHVIINKKKHSAISQSGYITKGEKIVAIDGQGETLIVKHYQEEKQS